MLAFPSPLSFGRFREGPSPLKVWPCCCVLLTSLCQGVFMIASVVFLVLLEQFSYLLICLPKNVLVSYNLPILFPNILSFNNSLIGFTEVAHLLSICTAHTKDPSSIPSTYTQGGSQPSKTTAPGNPNMLSLGGHLYLRLHTQACPHTWSEINPCAYNHFNC